MYSQEDREWALYVYSELGSLRAAQRETGVSAASIALWAASAGKPRPPRKEPVYLPLERKLELVARLEAGERADDLAAMKKEMMGDVYHLLVTCLGEPPARVRFSNSFSVIEK